MGGQASGGRPICQTFTCPPNMTTKNPFELIKCTHWACVVTENWWNKLYFYMQHFKQNFFVSVSVCYLYDQTNNCLKYGFFNKVISERWTLLQHHAQKWGQICCKSVQLVKGSSFRNDLLQNPYFRAVILV